MHQIRLQLGLRHRLRWGSLQCSPNPLAGFRGPTFEKTTGKEREKNRKKGGLGSGEKERERERKERG